MCYPPTRGRVYSGPHVGIAMGSPVVLPMGCPIGSIAIPMGSIVLSWDFPLNTFP